MKLADVRTFMYQIDETDKPGAIDRLAKSPYDMIIVEPTGTLTDNADFDMPGMVATLRKGKPSRIVLAYLNVGQAERYRTYWQRDWKAPTKSTKGHPDFILTDDPDGWSDNYPVAYWDRRWQAILATDPKSDLHQLMSAGFDGLYLDWIDGYSEDAIVTEATRQNVDPARAMVDWIATIRTTALQTNPAALIVVQNAPYLVDDDARYSNVIDGIGFEDTWFRGEANASWGNRKGGDIPNQDKDEYGSERLIAQYGKYLRAGRPVFTIDYCLRPANAQRVYAASRAAQFVPLVTQVSLSRLTTTPPP